MPTFDKRHARNALTDSSTEALSPARRLEHRVTLTRSQTRAPKHSHPFTDSSTEALPPATESTAETPSSAHTSSPLETSAQSSPRRSTHPPTEDTIAEPKGQHTRAPKRPRTLAHENLQDNSRSVPSYRSPPHARLHQPVRHTEIDLPTRTPGV